MKWKASAVPRQAGACSSGKGYGRRAEPGTRLAVHMVISPFTAKTHISRAMTRLGARDRAQLVVFAHESGLVVARGG